MNKAVGGGELIFYKNPVKEIDKIKLFMTLRNLITKFFLTWC